MATTVTGQITITDVADGVSLSMYLGVNQSTTQIYDNTTGVYTPDYTTSSLVVTPYIYSSAGTTNLSGNIISNTWSINGVTLSSSNYSTYGASVGSSAPYALTLSKNMSDNAVNITSTVEYYDTTSGITTTTQAIITLTKSINTGTGYTVLVYAPDGNVFKSAEDEDLYAQCDVYSGGEKVVSGVTYKWYSLVSGSWNQITGETNNMLAITPDDVPNSETFKCIATVNGYTPEGVIQFYDLSDPYIVEITANPGTTFSSSVTSIELTASVWSGGYQVTPSTPTVTWTKYTTAGVVDTLWGDEGSYTTDNNAMTLTITSDDIVGGGIFGVEISYTDTL